MKERLLDRYWVPGESIANVVITQGAVCILGCPKTKDAVRYEVSYTCGCTGFSTHGRLRRRAAVKAEHTGACGKHAAKAKAKISAETAHKKAVARHDPVRKKTINPWKADITPYYEGDPVPSPQSRLYPVYPRTEHWGK